MTHLSSREIDGMNVEQRQRRLEELREEMRDKIDRRFGVTSLETLRGVGYRLNPVTLDPPDGPP